MKNVLNSITVCFAVMVYFAIGKTAFAATPGMTLDSGSTAWMLTSALLVLMMTLPGLALFYGGMVHKESVLATLMQSFVATTVVTILWMIYGYSLIFTEHTRFIGDLSKFLLEGVGINSTYGAPPAVIPETVYIMFQ